MLTIAIPTYGRGAVLLDTIAHCLAQKPAASQILVLDQTVRHSPDVAQRLRALHAAGSIRWMRLPEPSIVKAMNSGLLFSDGDIVLFLDDDIIPEPGLVAAHLDAHHQWRGCLIAGRVIQPWQEGGDFSDEPRFHFAVTRDAWITEFMGGNFSVRRQEALAIGGFDENFVRVAYRFESEFAYRWCRSGARIRFVPGACIHHLKVASGGTRSWGDHLRDFAPSHSVGAYYYILRTWSGRRSLGALARRPFAAVATRFHLARPWRIPATLFAEFSGLAWAVALVMKGPRGVFSATDRAGRVIEEG